MTYFDAGMPGGGDNYFDSGQPGGGDEYFDGGTPAGGDAGYYNSAGVSVSAAGQQYYAAGGGTAGDGYFDNAGLSDYPSEPVIDFNTSGATANDGGDIPDSFYQGMNGMNQFERRGVGDQPPIGRKILG